MLQAVGASYYKWLGKIVQIGHKEQDNGQWDKRSFHMDFVIGACMFLPMSFITEVGPMNEEYFLYCEEIDWAIRGKRKGWGLAFCPDVKVYHKMGASTLSSSIMGNSELSDFYSVRNRVLLALTYFPWTLITLYSCFLLFILNRIKRKQYRRIGMLIKILLDPYRHFRKSK